MDWDGFIERVKKKLDALDLELAKTMEEHTGKGVYAIVSLG